MFEKVNPFGKEEMDQETAAQKCGCRCVSGSQTIGNAINLGIASNGCFASCKSTANKKANKSAAKNDKKY